MQSDSRTAFRSRLAPLFRLCAWFALAATAVSLGVAITDQISAKLFPDYLKLALFAAIPLAIAAVAAVLCYLAVATFTVKVLPEGLRCYDNLGLYRTLPWAQIHEVSRKRMLGLPYLYVNSLGLKRPVTLPLWLADMPAFTAAVQAQAGEDHLLVKALREHA